MADNKKVLVIDDEPDTRTFLSALLEDNGFEVVTANDGEEGLKVVRVENPDLITLDITMPEKSGVGVYREMRTNEQLKGIPIIIVTGVSTDFERFISSRGKVPPPDGYVAKPIDQDKLLSLARELTAS